MLAIAAVLAVVALLAAVPLTRLPGPLLRFGYLLFAISLTGQINALPLIAVAAILAWFAQGAAAWVLGAAAVLFAFAHWRNRLAGRLLLDAAGLTETRIPWLAGIAPFLLASRKVRQIKDLRYGDKGARNLLDLIVPRELPATPMPILVHVHGGGWTMGGKGQQAKPLLNRLAAGGWLCVDVGYRLGPAERMPAMIVDVLRAIAWVRAHAPDYGGDPTRIAITGGSAGGHLAVLAALAHDDASLKPGFDTADCSVAMAVAVYGVYDMLDRDRAYGPGHDAIVGGFLADNVMPGPVATCQELWRAMSPLERLRPDAPPMLIIHGTGDALQPYRNARSFAEALRKTSQQPVVLVELPAIEHAYDMGASAVTWAHVRAVEAFLAPLAVMRPAAGHAAVPAARTAKANAA